MDQAYARQRIADVAYQSGFTSTSSFSRVFKERLGQSLDEILSAGGIFKDRSAYERCAKSFLVPLLRSILRENSLPVCKVRRCPVQALVTHNGALHGHRLA